MKIVKINAVWCSACLVMKKTYQKIADKYPEIEFISYDYDLDEDKVKFYDVQDIIPVLIILDDDDHEIARIVGEKTFSEIDEIIKKVGE